MAELKQQNKTPTEEKSEDVTKEDPLVLDMSKKNNCNRILNEKLKASKQTMTHHTIPKARKVEKTILLEQLCDIHDIERKISITKITNKLSNTDISSEVSIKSFTPDEVSNDYDALSRDVEM